VEDVLASPVLLGDRAVLRSPGIQVVVRQDIQVALLDDQVVRHSQGSQEVGHRLLGAVPHLVVPCILEVGHSLELDDHMVQDGGPEEHLDVLLGEHLELRLGVRLGVLLGVRQDELLGVHLGVHPAALRQVLGQASPRQTLRWPC